MRRTIAARQGQWTAAEVVVAELERFDALEQQARRSAQSDGRELLDPAARACSLTERGAELRHRANCQILMWRVEDRLILAIRAARP